jgi:hypothetical protein
MEGRRGGEAVRTRPGEAPQRIRLRMGIGRTAFPVFSFIADSELRATRAESRRPH